VSLELLVSVYLYWNNIYFQVALIMLIGLLAKNAILIVEFAIQRRRNGMDLTKAAIEGASSFTSILMTSLAFIFGLLPLAPSGVLWVTVPSGWEL
jgi:HAE1 family hydrophobic/amphiphilic exporter-1